ncbi:unnamed protein product, partial [Prorocentrum cordatum]
MHGSRDLFESVPAVLIIMNQCGLATGLYLNNKKTVIVFMASYSEQYIRDRFDELGVDLASIQVRVNGKYLGIYLGRGGDELSWQDPRIKYVRRVRELRGLGMSFVENILCSKTLAVPVTQFVGQFFEPPPALFRLEDECLQLLVNGPRHAVPRAVFLDLENIGIKVKESCLYQLNQVMSFLDGIPEIPEDPEKK